MTQMIKIKDADLLELYELVDKDQVCCQPGLRSMEAGHVKKWIARLHERECERLLQHQTRAERLPASHEYSEWVMLTHPNKGLGRCLDHPRGREIVDLMNYLDDAILYSYERGQLELAWADLVHVHAVAFQSATAPEVSTLVRNMKRRWHRILGEANWHCSQRSSWKSRPLNGCLSTME